MPRVSVSGGPCDGLKVRAGGEWRWLHPTRGKGFARPGAGRALYRLREAGYVFAGHHEGHCEGCGGFVERGQHSCPLCGTRLR